MQCSAHRTSTNMWPAGMNLFDPPPPAKHHLGARNMSHANQNKEKGARSERGGYWQSPESGGMRGSRIWTERLGTRQQACCLPSLGTSASSPLSLHGLALTPHNPTHPTGASQRWCFKSSSQFPGESLWLAPAAGGQVSPTGIGAGATTRAERTDLKRG